jgi:hypothetical protein
VTAEPLWPTWAFQAEVTAWVPVKDQVAVQEVTAGPPLVTVTLAVNPPVHWFTW